MPSPRPDDASPESVFAASVEFPDKATSSDPIDSDSHQICPACANVVDNTGVAVAGLLLCARCATRSHKPKLFDEDLSPRRHPERTLVEAPSKTAIVRMRIDPGQQVTNARARRQQEDALREQFDAEVATSDRDKREKLLSVMFNLAQSVERTVVERLSRYVTDTVAARWLVLLGDQADFGSHRLRAFLRNRQRPSFAVVTGWLYRWRIKPEALAGELQDALGVPHGLEKDVFVCSQLRNMEGHRPDYECGAEGIDRDAAAFIAVVERDGLKILEITDSTVDWANWLCSCVIERRNRPR